MKKIKAVVLTSVLVLGTLMVAAPRALAGDKAASIEGSGTGRLWVNTTTGAVTGHDSGVSSHLGRYTADIQGHAERADDGTLTGSGTVTIVAANGDQLTGPFTLSGDGETQTVVVTITGGTGRFTNASGTLTVICRSSGPPREEGDTLVFDHECTMKGTIRS
jgi:hypothetical protein